ncbi:MAG: MFS transporter [Trebonia sp.]
MPKRVEFSGPGPDPERATRPEDAGRLDGASRGRLIAIIAALVLFSEVAPFQAGMISYIVPKIAVTFPQAGANVTWSVTMLGVAGGATLALVGKLGDQIGKKKVLLLCGVLFIIGCVICALTSNWALFLVGRGLGGVSFGMTAVEYGVVRDAMPRRWIPVTIGIIGTGFGVSGILGPLICGWLTDNYSWRSVFWFLIIYMIVTFPIVILAVPESPLRIKQRFDVVGSLLFGIGIGTVLVYLSEGSSWGWGTIGCLAYLIGGLVALAAFVVWELTVPAEPIMDFSMLRAPKVLTLMMAAFFVTGIITALSIAIAYMFETPTQAVLKQQILAGVAAQTHQPLSVVAQIVHFQGDLSYATAGFSVLALAVHITMWTSLFGMIAGPIGGHIARKVGGRLPLLISAGSLVIGTALWVQWHTTWQEQLGIGVFYGVGFGFYYAANPNLLMDAVPAERQGIASGLLAVFGCIGTSAATALFTAIMAAHPLRIAITAGAGHQVVSTVPGVYSNSGYSLVYILLGIVPAALTFIIVYQLHTGRTPALGGASAPAQEEVAPV